jgi:hypothetical protein
MDNHFLFLLIIQEITEVHVPRHRGGSVNGHRPAQEDLP